MEIETAVSFSRAELYVMLESVPDSNNQLLSKLSEALGKLEMPLRVYGNGVNIKPKEIA